MGQVTALFTEARYLRYTPEFDHASAAAAILYYTFMAEFAFALGRSYKKRNDAGVYFCCHLYP